MLDHLNLAAIKGYLAVGDLLAQEGTTPTDGGTGGVGGGGQTAADGGNSILEIAAIQALFGAIGILVLLLAIGKSLKDFAGGKIGKAVQSIAGGLVAAIICFNLGMIPDIITAAGKLFSSIVDAITGLV